MARETQLPPQAADPQPELAWKLWYRDTFDRQCPASVDVQGQGLARGLMELWARQLAEGSGFSAFSLECEGRSLRISGPEPVLSRLREWLFEGRSVQDGYLQAAHNTLLQLLAGYHAREGAEALMELVGPCESRSALLLALKG